MQVRTMRALLVSLMGPVIWSAHFFLMYAAQTVACAISPVPSQGFDLIWVALTAAAGLALLIMLGYQLSAGRAARRAGASADFLRSVQIALVALSLVGVAWVALAAAFLRADICT